MVKRSGSDEGFFEDLFEKTMRWPFTELSRTVRSSSLSQSLSKDWSRTSDGSVSLELELPGIKKTDVSVTVTEETVLVKANDRRGCSLSWLIQTKIAGQPIDLDSIVARLEDGLLTISGKIASPCSKAGRLVKID